MSTPKIIFNQALQKLQPEIQTQLDDIKSGTSKLKENDIKFPDYNPRNDYHQSANSITICFYLKNIYTKTFKHLLTSANQTNQLTIKTFFDKNFRSVNITLELPEKPKSIQKITVTPTKVEVVLVKNSSIQYNLPKAKFDIKNNEFYSNFLLELTKKKHVTSVQKATITTVNPDGTLKETEEPEEIEQIAPDELYAHEYKDMPDLIANLKKDDQWLYDNYVDSDDSSLAGIDDIEWVEGGNKTELQKEVIPESEGGTVPDEVVERMAELKVKLEQGSVKNQQ